MTFYISDANCKNRTFTEKVTLRLLNKRIEIFANNIMKGESN